MICVCVFRNSVSRRGKPHTLGKSPECKADSPPPGGTYLNYRQSPAMERTQETLGSPGQGPTPLSLAQTSSSEAVFSFALVLRDLGCSLPILPVSHFVLPRSSRSLSCDKYSN